MPIFRPWLRPGDYSLAAAEIIGPAGRIYALDIWQSMVESLENEARNRGIENIRPMVADITAPLPFYDMSMDVCLIATVFHIPKITPKMSEIGMEVRRVLKKGGRLVIIECNSKDTSFGPPIELRLSPENITRQIGDVGFRKTGLLDFGYTYLVHFE